MNKNLYAKLARNNIKKNKSTYFPYIFSSIVMIGLFYILFAIAGEVRDNNFYGGTTMTNILNLGVYAGGVFSALFIFYTNSFLLKRRKKEFGLYSVLGMEKKHISKVIFYEVIYSGGISLIFGLLFGVLFSKLMFAFLLNIFKLDTGISLSISIKPILITVLFFLMIFALEILYNTIKIKKINPIDLISGGGKGEREPKSNWIIGLLGLISLGTGYYIAFTIENPINAITMFFLAIILVAVGTYGIFTSGSIIFLKLLRKNKNFYYKKNNFISISNMMYRMKQNAVGLANIAILSTGVLLMLSTTVSLYVGMEDIMSTRYPKDVITRYSIFEEEDLEAIENTILEKGKVENIKIKNPMKYYSTGFAGYRKDNELIGNVEFNNNLIENIYEVNLFTLDDYNREHNLDFKLDKGQVFVNSDISDFNYKDIVVLGKRFKVKENLETLDFPSTSIIERINIVVSDLEEIKSLNSILNQLEENDIQIPIRYEYNFDIEGKLEDKISFASNLSEFLYESIGNIGSVDDKYTSRQDFLSIYGSLFFIGIFLGTLFMVATVLIIYYKQISEGYEDRERFIILQKVGMSKEEVKKTIKSQILLVFFLPLVTAIIHIIVAFPIVIKILEILYLTNTKLFVSFTGIVILLFAVSYGIVYRWTAKVYYKIVN